MKKILIFKVPNVDFKKIIEKETLGKEINTLADLVKVLETKKVEIDGIPHTNVDDGQKEDYIKPLVVIYGSDFASVNSHVILNFVNGILKKFTIDNLYIQNPPYRIEKSKLSNLLCK